MSYIRPQSAPASSTSAAASASELTIVQKPANSRWIGSSATGTPCARPSSAIDRLWHIGASTHPGPGLGAGSGTLVAKQLLEPPLRARLLARLRR